MQDGWKKVKPISVKEFLEGAERRPYEPPRVILSQADIVQSESDTPMDILRRDLEDGVRLRLPTSVFRYLTLTTEFDIQAWECSSAKFVDKWRLAMLIAKGEADSETVLSVMQGGVLYPIEEESRETNYLDNEVENGKA